MHVVLEVERDEPQVDQVEANHEEVIDGVGEWLGKTYLNPTALPAVQVTDHPPNWMAFDDLQTWNHLQQVVDTFGH